MIDRITILGGSSVYIPEFILSVISHNLKVREIVLYGEESRKLELVTAFSKRLVRRSGYPITITASKDLEEAVKDAKYILNHIRVGGMKARMRDEMLPPKFNMLGDESLGAGAFSHAMRTLPLIFEAAKTIEAVNPNATILNLTNPVGIMVEAFSRSSKLKVAGACDLPGEYAKKIYDLLECSPEETKIDYVGLYHQGWIQDVKIDGRSRMGQLLELLEKEKEDGFDHDLIQLFRMIPTRVTGRFFHRAELLKKQKSCTRFRAEILHEAEAQILKLYEDEHLNEIPELTRQRNALWYENTILPVIEALENEHATELVLCVRNNKCIRDLPEDASVEIPTGVSNRGIKPHRVGSLPRFLKGMFIATKESDRLTVEAARHRSYEYALQALTINPFVPSLEIAKKFLDRIIKEDKLELH